jgi:hypothetical protein
MTTEKDLVAFIEEPWFFGYCQAIANTAHLEEGVHLI